MNAFRPYRTGFARSAKPRFNRGISKKGVPANNTSKLTAAGQPSGRRSISRIGKHWKNKPALILRRDGKEVCNLAVPEGCAEYRYRILLMWIRQDGLCCDCLEPLKLSESTFEHENGRGAAKRDDRIAIFEDDHFIRHINGAAHLHCNSQRGSKRTEIFHGSNCLIEKEKAA